MTRWAALLRGVNVGGNRRLPMIELTRCLEGLGYADVRTLLASGNAVFAAPGHAAEVETAIEAALADRLGMTTDVVVRSAAEMAQVVAANPFSDAGNPSQLQLLFHRDPVPADRVAALLEGHAGPERVGTIGRELYIDFAGAMRDSTLPARMAKLKFPIVATGRNMNTVAKLDALLRA